MPAKKPTQSPSETPLRVPKHGRGKLRVGGTNRGGPGRPPEALRVSMRNTLDKVLAKIDEQLASGTATQEFLVKAGELLAKHSLPQQREISGRDGAPIEQQHTERQVLVFGDKEIRF